MRVASFTSLDPASYREIVRRALAEDVRWGDVTTEAIVPAEVKAIGVIVVGTPCVLAGLEVALECFRQLDPHVEVDAARREGEHCESGAELARLRGVAAALFAYQAHLSRLDLRAAKRQLALENALLAAMTGDFDSAEAAAMGFELQDPSYGWGRVLRGQV